MYSTIFLRSGSVCSDFSQLLGKDTENLQSESEYLNSPLLASANEGLMKREDVAKPAAETSKSRLDVPALSTPFTGRGRRGE